MNEDEWAHLDRTLDAEGNATDDSLAYLCEKIDEYGPSSKLIETLADLYAAYQGAAEHIVVEDIIDALATAIELDPENVSAHESMGLFRARINPEDPLAAHHLQVAILLDPSRISSYIALAKLYGAQNDHERALDLLNRADPGHQVDRFHQLSSKLSQGPERCNPWGRSPGG